MEQFQTFFYNNGYVLELLCCNLLFSYSQQKRNRYLLRILASAVLMLLSAQLLNQIPYESVYFNFLKYIIWFFIALGMNLFSCEISFPTALFIGVGAFIGQHISFKIGEVVLFFIPESSSQLTANLAYLSTIFGMWLIVFFVFARRFKRLDMSSAMQDQLLVLYIAVAVYITILQYIVAGYIPKLTATLYLIYASYDIICCLFAITLQSGMITANSLIKENKIMEQVLYMQNEKYKMSKETIELINIKFHDLKNQLAMLDDLEGQEKENLRKTLNIYDMSIKSGNEALDIVLAEKSLICETKHIRLECIANGKSLSFMSTSDIYSLFGNAIDNGLESVLKLVDRDKRYINISVKEAHSLLIIHIENPYHGELWFQNGLPVTTKADKAFHGYGMKSIQKVVEKYNGYFSINAKNHLFVLNVVLPLPQSEA